MVVTVDMLKPAGRKLMILRRKGGGDEDVTTRGRVKVIFTKEAGLQ